MRTMSHSEPEGYDGANSWADNRRALIKAHAAAKLDAQRDEDVGRLVPIGRPTIQRFAVERDVHGFQIDMGNRKARRAAWAKTRKVRARFEDLTKQEDTG